MLFQERHIGPIERGEKTQTRRVWKRRHARVGGVYAVQTRFFGTEDDARGWIRVTALREEPVLSISEADARAEGGYTQREFLDLFKELHPARWPFTGTLVTVITFDYAGRQRP